MTISKSTLSIKRIIITIILSLLIPLLYPVLNYFIDNKTISYTILINIIGCIIFIYDYDLLALHYNRIKKNFKESIIFYFVGLIFFSILYAINHFFLKGYIPTIDPTLINNYIAAMPLFFIAYTFIMPILVNIFYKCLTDHLSIKDKETLVIAFSGIIFGLIFTIAFVPFSLNDWLRSFIFISIQVAFLSYSYNQSTSFLPGAMAMGTILLIYNLLLML